MPKRSNVFQKLIKSIYDGFGLDWTVTESEFLMDTRTGEPREVDIVARGPAGGLDWAHSVTLCVECIDRSRPADVTWVEQMVQKHKDLETDVLVLWSAAGFYKTAYTKAKKLKARPITPDGVSDASWSVIARRFEGSQFKYVEPNFDTPTIYVKLLTGTFQRLTVTETMYAVRKGNNFKIGLLGYLPLVKNHKAISDVLLKHATSENHEFHCGIDFPEGTKFYFNSKSVSTGELHRLYIGIRAHVSEAAVDARSLMVNGTIHTQLNARTLPTEFNFCFQESKENPATGILTRLKQADATTSKLNIQMRERSPEVENASLEVER